MNERFTKALVATGAIFNREVNAELVKLYAAALHGHSLDACADALARLMSTAKFFPKPAEIIEALEGDFRAQAQAAWPEVQRLCTNIDNAKSEDPITEAVVSEMGGWQRFGLTPYSEHVWLQKEFIERYEAYKSTPTLLAKAQDNAKLERTGELKRIGEVL